MSSNLLVLKLKHLDFEVIVFYTKNNKKHFLGGNYK